VPKVLHDIVRLAAELAGCRVGGLLLNRAYSSQLKLAAVYGVNDERLGENLSHEDGLVGQVARKGTSIVAMDLDQDQFLRSMDLKVAAAVPLRAPSGEVEAVLFVGDSADHGPFRQTDISVLEDFATQAAIALRTSRLLDREQRYFSQIAILQQIGHYIQGADSLEKILHTMLTGVTASYGLGFNRAVLMLVSMTLDINCGGSSRHRSRRRQSENESGASACHSKEMTSFQRSSPAGRCGWSPWRILLMFLDAFSRRSRSPHP